MGPHWEAERLVVDNLGEGGGGAATALTGMTNGTLTGTLAPVAAKKARELLWYTLDQLRFY